MTNVIAEEQPPETELVGDHAQKLYGSYRDWKTTSSMPLGYGIAATAEETELANKADYSNAVSYTHLDVYKRQVMPLGLVDFPIDFQVKAFRLSHEIRVPHGVRIRLEPHS